MPDKKSPTRDIISIVFRLTLTCLVAGLIMGGAFLITHDAKEKNEIARDNKVMYSLLGYDKQNPKPETMSEPMPIHRYILDENGKLSIGYTVPMQDKSSTLIVMDLEGHFVSQYPISHDFALQNNSDGDRAVQGVIGSNVQARYADTIVVIKDNGKRFAYILDGKYPGFKTTIKVKMALKANYDLFGFEVLEHEEDPGLGAEIIQPYFKDQFDNKTAEQLKTLDVIKDPLPDDYRDALMGKIKDENQKSKILETHKNDPIYALTGATISSRSVLNGNKGIVRKFIYRIEALDKVIKEQNIQTTLRDDILPTGEK